MAATAALVFAGKSVATPAISFIVNKAFGYLSEWYKPNNLEQLKNDLSEKLKQIQAVYDAVDRQEISEQSNGLDEWLWRFRDAVEEAEDALDEMDYHKLKEEAEAHSLEQVRNPFTKFFKEKIVGKAARMTPEGNMVEKLREAIERLHSVATDVGGFLQLLCRVDNLVLQDRAERRVHQTSSILVPIEIFGRDSEKNQVMRWLTDNVHDDPNTVTQVPVFAIIGIGAKRIGTSSEQVENMENLFNLRYVSYGTNGFGQCPIGRLTSLQELYNFSIQSKEGYRISSLMNLTSLCKLRVCNLENVERHEEVIEAKINEKSHLRSLSLNWSETNDALKEDNLVLDKLEPHARLENLEITGYNGVRFPPWINHPPLINMVSLELRQCKRWVCLPSLGNLQLLKHLELQNLTGLEQIGQSSADSFPQNLKTLVVEGCQRLRKLPLLPLTLMQLEINNVGLDILPRIVVHHGNIGPEAMPPKLVSVIISNCSNLTTLAESFLLQEHYICTLRILKIVDCKKLIHAPLSFGSMNGLTEFRIGSCYSLRMMEKVDGGLLPCTLKELSMVQCGDLQLPLLNSLVGLTNLTSLSLCNCSRVKSLPSSEVFRSLTALREMVVTNCIFLSSLGGLGALSYLSWLEITDCDQLQVAAEIGEMDGDSLVEVSLKVYTLWIHTTFMLKMEPLSRLCSTTNLIISVGCGTISQQWMRQNRRSLETLEILKPEIMLWLKGFHSLKRLEFDVVPCRLPFPYLPSSLESFIIRECDPEVAESWKKKESPEWEKISRIGHVRIGDTNYYLGQERRVTNLVNTATHFESCGSLRGKRTKR
ncbi:hypothetical protein ZWY2020_015832 [Hordeum vulgare]|nr:hypothetical protein ZWY2020_015832 [Hordeum vulgare]